MQCSAASCSSLVVSIFHSVTLLRNAVLRAGGELGVSRDPCFTSARSNTKLAVPVARRGSPARLDGCTASKELGGCRGGRGLCHTWRWRKTGLGTRGFVCCVGGWLRERWSGGFARAARCAELCRVLLQAVGKGWSQHTVGALALDAECCCVLSPAQRLANTVCLSASTSDLLASPPALPAKEMLLCGCQRLALGSPVLLGMAEMTLFNFSARRTLESRGNRTPCCLTVPFRDREAF